MSSIISAPQSGLVPVTFGSPFFRADGELTALAFSPDGKLWSVEDTGILRRWDFNSGRAALTHSLSDMEHTWRFNNDASKLASANNDLSIWDPATGSQIACIAQNAWVTALAWHPNSNIVATGHDDGLVCLWDIENQKLLTHFSRHNQPVSAIAFSRDGSRLATAAEDKLIYLWQWEDGRDLGCLEGHKDRIPTLAWHPDGKTLASAGWDTTARLWDVETLAPVILLNSHDTQVWTLAFSDDGAWLACADSTPAIHIWQYETKRTIHVIETGDRAFKHLDFSRGGSQLAGASVDTIQFWDPLRGTALTKSTETKHGRAAMSLQPDGSRLATNSAHGLRIWDTRDEQQPMQQDGKVAIHCLAHSSDNRWLAGGGDSEVHVWNATTGKRHRILTGPKEPTTILEFSSNAGELAAASSFSKSVWLWNCESGEPTLLIPNALDDCSVEALAFHPHADLLAVGGIDQKARSRSAGAVSLWDINKRCETATFAGAITSLTFNPSGRFLISGDLDAWICVWDIEKKDLVRELNGHDTAIRALLFSPDGRFLVSAGDDRTIRIWDAKTWTEKYVHELDNQIKKLAFSPDGEFLYSGNGNGTCYKLSLSQLLNAGA